MIWISILRQYGNQFHPLWNLPGVYAAQHMQQETSWILWVSSRVLRCTHISRTYLNLLNPVSHTRWRPSKESTVVAFRARPWWWHVGIWVSSWSWSVCPSHKSCSSGQKGMGLWREELNTHQWKLTWLPQDEFQQIYQIYFFANICQGLLWSQVFTLILWYSLFLFSTNLITGQESKGCRPFCFLALTWVVSFSNKLYSCIWWLYNGSIDLQKIFHHFWFVSERVVTPFWFFGWNTPGHRCCCHLDHFAVSLCFFPCRWSKQGDQRYPDGGKHDWAARPQTAQHTRSKLQRQKTIDLKPHNASFFGTLEAPKSRPFKIIHGSFKSLN